MSDMITQIHKLLVEVVLPNLKAILTSQAEQRYQSDCLNQNVEEFRSEMRIQFAEMRAELAATRLQLEDAVVTLREVEATQESGQEAGTADRRRKPLVH